ncbi:MAG: hypothetical protein J1F35_03685 [Erysipelotrichales bacterium]|nr:hypothetical protein [Erysipelotrichales bacterium]
MLKEFNLVDLEQIVFGKVEYNNINRKIAESQGKEYEDVPFDQFLSKLNLNKEIFVYQNKNGDIEITPFQFIEFDDDQVLYYIDKLEGKHLDKLKEFINNQKQLNVRKLLYNDFDKENLLERYYLIKNGEIYLFD